MREDSFQFALDDFLNHLDIERGLSPNTIEAYKMDLNIFYHYLVDSFGSDSFSLDAVNRRHIRGYLKYLKVERRNGHAAMNRKISSLSTFFAFLAKEEYPISKNPLKDITRVKTRKNLPIFLSLQESEDLLESIKSTSSFPERDHAIYLIFLQTGCRLSELVNLTLEQVHLKDSYLRFLGKGNKERIVPLLPETVLALERWLEERSPRVRTDRVFLNRHGRPLGKRGIQNNLKKFFKEAGLYRKGLSVHKLRHTCLTLLHKKGVNIKLLKEIAGHTNISTTEIYTHVIGEEITEGMKNHPLNKKKEEE